MGKPLYPNLEAYIATLFPKSWQYEVDNAALPLYLLRYGHLPPTEIDCVHRFEVFMLPALPSMSAFRRASQS